MPASLRDHSAGPAETKRDSGIVLRLRRRMALPLLVAVTGSVACGGNVDARQGPPHQEPDGGTSDIDGADRPSCQRKRLSCRGRSCCAAAYVPGGTFDRYDDAAYPATVSAFHLDVFEVTVGRMRSFVRALEDDWRPPAGSGASPYATGTGWKAEWEEWAFLGALRGSLWIEPDPSNDASKYAVWTVGLGPNEGVPIAPLRWATAQAFCIWDGGRLPTLVEWRFAAAGGSEQRKYPWGDEPPTPELSLLNESGLSLGSLESYFVDAGSCPAGAARWGHLDMNGSRGEWVLDGNPATYPYAPEPILPCSDCVFAPLEHRPMAVDVSGRHLGDWLLNGDPDADWVSLKSPGSSDLWLGFRCVYGHTVVEE